MTITKKELRRFSKSQLLKISKENQIEVNRKSSKNVIVDIIYKNKQVRNTLTPPNKREPTAAQKAARERFVKAARERAMKTTTSNKVDIENSYPEPPKPLSKREQLDILIAKKLEKLTLKPTASNQPEPPKVIKPEEPVEVSKMIEAQVPTQKLKQDERKVEQEVQNKEVVSLNDKDQDKVISNKLKGISIKNDNVVLSRAMENAQRLRRHRFNNNMAPSKDDTNNKRLVRDLKMNAKVRQTRAIEQLVGANKTTDNFDRKLLNSQAVSNKQRFMKAIERQRHKEGLGFTPEIVDIDIELGIESSNPISKLASLLLERQRERQGGEEQEEQPQEEQPQEEQKEEEKQPEEDLNITLSPLTKNELGDILVRAGVVRSTEKERVIRGNTKPQMIKLVIDNKDKTEIHYKRALVVKQITKQENKELKKTQGQEGSQPITELEEGQSVPNTQGQSLSQTIFG